MRVLPMETRLAVLEEERGAWCDQFQGKSVLGTHDQGRRAAELLAGDGAAAACWRTH